MAKPRSFPVLIATDGSEDGTAAVNGAASFPWPAGAQMHAVVVRSDTIPVDLPRSVQDDIERSLTAVAEDARKALARRWPDAQARIIDGPTVDAINRHAERLKARVIVLGSQGRGPISRLLVGSVSLGVVRDMKHAALIVRGKARAFSRVTLGFDGSLPARHAVTLLASLEVPPGGRVTIVRVLERPAMPSLSRLPASARAAIAAQAAAAEEEDAAHGRRQVEGAAEELRGAGWKVDSDLRHGAPLDEMFAAIERTHAQLLVLGARGNTALERLVLGSVAEGALHRSPVSVLVTR
jgi:nucleotide-binding universal stress UspA family protein